MTTPAAQTTPTAPGGREPTLSGREPIPGGREPIPGGREPIPSGAPPGAPPEGTPFQSALETEWARTATAEGQQSHSESPSSATSHNTPVRRARGAGTGSSSIVLTPPGPSGTAVAVVAGGVASGAVAPSAASDPVANVAVSVPRTPAEHDAKDSASSLPVATELEGSPAEPKGAGPVPAIHTGALPASDSTPVAEDPALPASNGAAASPASHDSSTTQGEASPPLLRAPAAGVTLSAAAHTEGAGVGGDGSWSSQAGAHRPAGQQGPRSPGAEQSPRSAGAEPRPRSAGETGAHNKLWVPDAAQASPGAGAGSGGVATGGVGGLAEGSSSALVSATSSGGQAGVGQQGPLLDCGVGLQQAIETLHGTIQLAARQGLAQARIALEPEGLGEIHIHLTQTAQGLLARVTAETPAAAQALTAAHADLHRSLSSLGLNLARLSVGRHGHSAAQDGGTALGGGGREGAASGGEASSRGARPGQTAAAAAPTDPAPDSEAQEDAQLAPVPARGTLVDVLA